MAVKNITHKKIFEPERYFPQCHASTIAITNDGTKVCAWFAGAHEKNNDVAIWYSISKGDRWSEPSVACDTKDVPCWNPVLFSPDGTRLILYFKTGKQIPIWQTRYSISDDGGRTWSKHKEAVKGDVGGRGPVKNKPIRLSNGDILAPASLESNVRDDAYVDRSNDGGLHWHSFVKVPVDHDSLTGGGMIQPSIWESDRGCVHMLLRTGEGRIYRSDSTDYGYTWCNAYPTSMPNNNSGLDVAALEDGTLYLVCNPVEKDWGRRSPLSLFCSKDNGSTWILADEIIRDDHPTDCEFSYPSIVATPSHLHICYTWKRRSIAYVEYEINR